MDDLEKRDIRPCRTLLLGAGLSALVVYMAQYSCNIIHGSYLAIDHMPAGGIFLFFMLTFVFMAVLRAIKRVLDFTGAELVVVYIMLLVVSSIATMGLGTQFIPILAGPHYYASPENRWGEMILPHINESYVPRGAYVLRWLFEGRPRGALIPWSAWVPPFAVWFPFLFALYFVMVAITVVLRKQWMETERLAYPLCQLPLAMVSEENREGVLRPFFKSKLMWAGFALPFLVGLINGLHEYHHLIPEVPLVTSLGILRGAARLQIRLSFPVVGLAYFINLKVALGLWIFNVLSTLTQGTFLMLGIYSTENMGSYGAARPIFKHLGMGAITVYVFYFLWTARTHLKNVFRKAFLNASDVDDSGEIMSYRTAVIGGILCFIYMVFWLYRSGLPLVPAVLFMLLALLIFVGITRVVVEAGVPTLIAPSIAPSQLISSIGTPAIGTAGLVTLGFTYIWAADIRTFCMSASANSLKLTEIIKGSKRIVFWAMAIAIVIGVVGSSFVVLNMAYDNGGANMNNWYFNGNIRVAFQYVVNKMRTPEGPNPIGWLCKGVGAVIMVLLMIAHRRFVWWPLHPIGFTIGAVGWISALWFSIFLAWLIKSCILGFGGMNLYNKSRNFFLGLVLGQYTAAGMWFVIDAITGMEGNRIFWI
ncbi:MAG: hypothetical protein GXP25_09735 [Planctomycetes bacterium]|nr:hypothetical protein [Planctomycetota bacterium]